jgi:hypothetical protein
MVEIGRFSTMKEIFAERNYSTFTNTTSIQISSSYKLVLSFILSFHITNLDLEIVGIVMIFVVFQSNRMKKIRKNCS